MTPVELSRLTNQKEGTTLDFKRDLREESLRDLPKDLAAFANSDGGTILVGIDNSGEVLGVDWSVGKTVNVQQQGARCNPKIQPQISNVRVPKKGTVVVIEIPKSPSIHEDDHHRFPFRLGDSSVYMDATLLLQVAKNKGLISGEPVPLPTPVKRRGIRRLSFLGGYLSSPSPTIRVEAMKDIASISYNYSVEHIPNLQEELLRLLSDSNFEVRMNALQLFSTTYSRAGTRRKEQLKHRTVPKLEEVARKDSDTNVRNRAILTLCELGALQAIDVIIDTMRSEAEASYARLGVTNGFRLLVDQGLGYDLRRRLYRELESASASEMQNRLKQGLDVLRNMYWEK